MAYAFSQYVNGSAGTGVTSVSTATWTTTAGNLIVVYFFGSADDTGVTVTDAAGNTYHLAAKQVDTTDGIVAWIYYAYNALAITGGSVGANFTVSQNYPNIIAAEYSGIYSAGDPFVYSGSSKSSAIVVNPGTGSDVIATGAASPSPTKLPAMAFAAAVAVNVPTFSYGTGWTGRATYNKGYNAFEDQRVTSGTPNATFGDSGGGTDSYVVIQAVFAETGATSTSATLTLSETLGTLTLSANATHVANLSLSDTLGALTLSATATHVANLTLSGTLGPLTVSAAAVAKWNLSLSKTLGALTMTGLTKVLVSASLSKTLGPLTLSATIGTINTASLDQTLGTLTLSANLSVTGTGNELLQQKVYDIVNAGLAVYVGFAPSATVHYYYVEGQSPAKGTLVPPWTPISVTASDGPAVTAPTESAIPNVTGLTTYDARAALYASGFSLDEYTWAVDSSDAGTVLSQSPAAGTLALPGAIVSLTVSSGPQATVQTVRIPAV